jgi:hypothetical protein
MDRLVERWVVMGRDGGLSRIYVEDAGVALVIVDALMKHGYRLVTMAGPGISKQRITDHTPPEEMPPIER